MSERERMMKTVQMYSFAAHEANLFLDTHPKNKQALEYFKKMSALRDKAHREYVQKYGPLSVNDNAESDSWEWIKSPWPWMNESAGDR